MLKKLISVVLLALLPLTSMAQPSTLQPSTVTSLPEDVIVLTAEELEEITAVAEQLTIHKTLLRVVKQCEKTGKITLKSNEGIMVLSCHVDSYRMNGELQ